MANLPSLTAFTSFHDLLIWLYMGALLFLCLFGSHRLVLLVLYLRHRGSALHTPPPLDDHLCPKVLVQLPVYNEPKVIDRLMESASQLDWPKDKLLIQVLDDSTDETSTQITAFLSGLPSEDTRWDHLQRNSRTGFKAGALDEGLAACLEPDLVAIFDADFLITPDFLKRSVPLLLDEPKIGMVQARWGHLNRSENLLTRVQAILLDGHFVLEHGARFRAGRFFNFNGTAGLWRREAIDQAGGWQGDTLCEDLDLSYRSQLAGWRFAYLQDLVVPAELPATSEAFKSQQRRWAQGAVQVAAKLLPRLIRAPLPITTRLEAAAHLLGNLAFLPMALVLMLLPPVAILRSRLEDVPLHWLDLPIFVAATLNLALFYLFAEREVEKKSWWRHAIDIPWVLGTGAALCLNNARAVLAAALGQKTPFVRTPKAGTNPSETEFRRPKSRPKINRQQVLETFFGVYLLAAVALLFTLDPWSHSQPFLLLFGLSFLHLAWGGPTLFAASASPKPTQPRPRPG